MDTLNVTNGSETNLSETEACSNDHAALDMLNLTFGLLAFVTNAFLFYFQVRKRRNKSEQLEAAYAFGCAITGLAFATECDLCTTLWRGQTCTKRIWCIVLAPSSTMYMVGHMVTYTTMLYMVLLTNFALSPVRQHWITKPLLKWEIFAVFLMPVTTVVFGCWTAMVTDENFQQLTSSCFFRMIVPGEFIRGYTLMLAIFCVLIIVFFFYAMILMCRQNSVSSEVRMIQSRRKAKFYKKVTRTITFSIFTLLLPCLVEFAFTWLDIDPGKYLDYIWVLQPFGLSLYALSMTMRNTTIRSWSAVKLLNKKFHALTSKYVIFNPCYMCLFGGLKQNIDTTMQTTAIISSVTTQPQ